MPKIVPIVEGDGEVGAVPEVLKKILYGTLEDGGLQAYNIFLADPKSANGRDNLTKPGGLERFIRLAFLEPDCAAVLVLLDADDDCPVELVCGLAERVEAMYVQHPVVIVAAKRMFENWFLASLETIRGQELEGRPGIPEGTPIPLDADGNVEVGNGKSFINQHLPPGRAYKETQDQEALARLLNVPLALSEGRSRSFRRFHHAVKEIVSAIQEGRTRFVSPSPQSVASPPQPPPIPQPKSNRKRK